ncbi:MULTISPECIES: PRC and DUF2382 domain-containing protein [Nocardia]|uniref:DUF2382 domain-containing protein n=1 Tax=Nocardia TaxID=1817 RepID=UPI0015EE3C36|nr:MULTISPECIES: PRC and DUF2382 domain-containing protein [Nocardia]MCA2209240.1 PRC and DUF2382 domain-containing protein [Nocardia rosealba]
MSKATLDSLIGATAYDERGEKIGKVKQIYIDNNTGSPTWAAVSTGLFSADSLVPLAGAEHKADEDTLRLHVDKEQVKSAPHLDDGGRISAQSEQELFRHYHVDPRSAGWNTYGRQQIRPGTDEPMTHGNPAAMNRGTTDDSMIRSEEQLRVDTESEEVGTARLRKYVVTEEQTIKVPTTHEEAHIVREPITGERTGRTDIGDDEREVTLHADQVHVQKEAVPVERVRLEVDEVADEQTVSDTVRKERVETEGFDDDRRRNKP